MITAILVTLAFLPIVIALRFLILSALAIFRNPKPVFSPIDNDDAVSCYNTPIGFVNAARPNWKRMKS